MILCLDRVERGGVVRVGARFEGELAVGEHQTEILSVGEVGERSLEGVVVENEVLDVWGVEVKMGLIDHGAANKVDFKGADDAVLAAKGSPPDLNEDHIVFCIKRHLDGRDLVALAKGREEHFGRTLRFDAAVSFGVGSGLSFKLVGCRVPGTSGHHRVAIMTVVVLEEDALFGGDVDGEIGSVRCAQCAHHEPRWSHFKEDGVPDLVETLWVQFQYVVGGQ